MVNGELRMTVDPLDLAALLAEASPTTDDADALSRK